MLRLGADRRAGAAPRRTAACAPPLSHADGEARIEARICRNLERHCPDAFLVNLSNPMSRVTLAINRGTKVRNVGMCREMPIGVVRLARLLRMSTRRIDARASGINHFTFFTQMQDRDSGEDLLPRVRALAPARLRMPVLRRRLPPWPN
ncbi:hypothetical protein KF840_04255 [bacterium]|nr:hypothetical protein [bacterium]